MRTRTLGHKLTTTEKKYIAGQMAEHCRKVMDGDPSEPASWRRALRVIGCGVAAWREAETSDVAQFVPIWGVVQKYPLGMVQYNVRRNHLTRARGLAHEFAHALCQAWIPQMIFDADVVFSYHDDPRDARHQIARMFEEMMVG